MRGHEKFCPTWSPSCITAYFTPKAHGQLLGSSTGAARSRTLFWRSFGDEPNVYDLPISQGALLYFSGAQRGPTCVLGSDTAEETLCNDPGGGKKCRSTVTCSPCGSSRPRNRSLGGGKNLSDTPPIFPLSRFTSSSRDPRSTGSASRYDDCKNKIAGRRRNPELLRRRRKVRSDSRTISRSSAPTPCWCLNQAHRDVHLSGGGRKCGLNGRRCGRDEHHAG